MTAEDQFEDASHGLLSTRPDGTILRVNGTLLRWLGQPSEQVVGRRFADLLTPASRIYHETHYAPVLHLRDVVREVSLDLVRADGTRLPVLVSATLSRDDAHAPTAVRVAIVDATERREHERELLDASRRERERRELADLMDQRLGGFGGDEIRRAPPERP